jgi:hypothetical protein
LPSELANFLISPAKRRSSHHGRFAVDGVALMQAAAGGAVKSLEVIC